MYGAPIGPPTAPGFKPPPPPTSIWNRQVPGLSMGNYFTLLFGLAEVAQQQQQVRAAAVKASVAPNDIERMNAIAQGAMLEALRNRM